jgi:hypothetical protein
MNKAYEVQQQKWRAESDMETLMLAEEIRKDPKRLAAAKAAAKERYSKLEAAGLCSHKDKKK